MHHKAHSFICFIFYIKYYHYLFALLLPNGTSSLKNGSFLASDKSNAFFSAHHMTNLHEAVFYSPSCALSESIVRYLFASDTNVKSKEVFFLFVLVMTLEPEIKPKLWYKKEIWKTNKQTKKQTTNRNCVLGFILENSILFRINIIKCMHIRYVQR